MSLISLASGQSVYRGYEYYEKKHVIHFEKSDDEVYSGLVAGSGNAQYNVTIDLTHPRKSQCTCPHAAGRRIICKHMIAMYFTAFPQEAEQYIEDLEAYWAEEEAQQEEMEQLVIQKVQQMKKLDLQMALLQLLFDGPEWQYDRFIEGYVDR